MLSMMLPGCAATVSERPPASVLAVEVKDVPPAELLLCPGAPEPFPVDQAATIPAPVRKAMIANARLLKTGTDQLRRLINWSRPGSC